MKYALEEKKHFHEIDVLYALGAILAILGHSHPNDWNAFPGQWVEFIYSFHMPLFFAIAGFLFAQSQSVERLGYGRWLKEKALRLLSPYFVLSLVALVPKYVLEHGGLSEFTPQYLAAAFFVPRQNVWGHFWFLPVLFLMYAIFGVLRQIGTASKTGAFSWRWMMLFLIAVCLHFLKPNLLWFGISDLCNYSVYFLLGYAVFCFQLPREKVCPARGYALLAGVLLAVTLCMWKLVPRSDVRDFVIAILMLSCMYAVGHGAKKRNTPGLDFIAQFVFTFYIYSWPAQAIVERLCSHYHISWMLTTPIMFGTGMLCPAILILLYRKCAFLHCRFADLVLGMRE